MPARTRAMTGVGEASEAWSAGTSTPCWTAVTWSRQTSGVTSSLRVEARTAIIPTISAVATARAPRIWTSLNAVRTNISVTLPPRRNAKRTTSLRSSRGSSSRPPDSRTVSLPTLPRLGPFQAGPIAGRREHPAQSLRSGPDRALPWGRPGDAHPHRRAGHRAGAVPVHPGSAQRPAVRPRQRGGEGLRLLTGRRHRRAGPPSRTHRDRSDRPAGRLPPLDHGGGLGAFHPARHPKERAAWAGPFRGARRRSPGAGARRHRPPHHPAGHRAGVPGPAGTGGEAAAEAGRRRHPYTTGDAGGAGDDGQRGQADGQPGAPLARVAWLYQSRRAGVRDPGPRAARGPGRAVKLFVCQLGDSAPAPGRLGWRANAW